VVRCQREGWGSSIFTKIVFRSLQLSAEIFERKVVVEKEIFECNSDGQFVMNELSFQGLHVGMLMNAIFNYAKACERVLLLLQLIYSD
jgi:hypothetical protein